MSLLESFQESLEQSGMKGLLGDMETSCGSLRVNLAGNQISTLITPKNITPLERLFRRNPVDGTLSATPSRPFRFEMGSIPVPAQMVLVLLDWRFAVYKPSGIVAGDVEQFEDRRLATSVGYDVKYTDTRKANLSYQLEPSDPAPSTDGFASAPNAGSIPGNGVGGVAQSIFARLRAEQATGGVASSLSTLPQRHRRDSQLQMPFTYLVNENKRVSFETVVFRPIPVPVSFFEVEVSGFFIGKNAIEEWAQGIVSCVGHKGV